MHSFLFEFSSVWLSLQGLFQLNDSMISESTYCKTLPDIFSTHNHHFVGQLIVLELMWSSPCKSEVAAAGLKAEIWGFMAEFSFQVMGTGLLHLERKTNIWLSYQALKAEWKWCKNKKLPDCLQVSIQLEIHFQSLRAIKLHILINKQELSEILYKV